MVLKRKRSESEFSFSSAFSSPPRPGSSTFDFTVKGPEICELLSSRALTPSHLPSRTMKRFRDNRPSEAEIHRRTLNLLYSAQQQHLPSVTQPHLSAISTPRETEIPSCRNSQQRSLHSFWNLPVATSCSVPSPSISAAAPSLMTNQNMALCCEDCGSGPSNRTDVAMMDVEGSETDNQSCGACGKVVCFSCSISNLGEERRCLVCAERSVWKDGVSLKTGVAC